MIGRLTAMLHDEGDGLGSPRAPLPEILRAGVRRGGVRVAGAGVAAALAVVAVVGGAAAGAGGHPAAAHDRASSRTITARTPAVGYTVAKTLYRRPGRAAVSLNEDGQALYYTSSGLVVRTNATGIPDGASPYHFTRVTADGRSRVLHVPTGDFAPSADPREPYLAWATMSAGQIRVVVHSVKTDRNVATVKVPGTFTWGGWEAPPVVLSGAKVYVGTDDQTRVVAWQTGHVGVAHGVPASAYPAVAGGRAVVTHGAKADIVNAVSGRHLRTIPISPDDFVSLSPDGRFATVDTGYGAVASPYEKVYSVATGSKIRLPGTAWGYGWTHSGNKLFRVVGHTMTTCRAATGACHTATVPRVPAHAFIHYAGRLYEA
jgi:hypothetical protein